MTYRQRDSSERAEMPSLGRLAAWWAHPDQANQAHILLSAGIDWNAPFCFRCLWKPPVGHGPQAWSKNLTGSWLDRGHLVDFCLGGPNDASNLVPLCHLCHDLMPAFDERADAIEWVAAGKSPVPYPHLWQAWTDAFASRGSGGASLRTRTLRLKANYCETLMEAASLSDEDRERLLLSICAMKAAEQTDQERRVAEADVAERLAVNARRRVMYFGPREPGPDDLSADGEFGFDRFALATDDIAGLSVRTVWCISLPGRDLFATRVFTENGEFHSDPKLRHTYRSAEAARAGHQAVTNRLAAASKSEDPK